jgi:hypothetical protein
MAGDREAANAVIAPAAPSVDPDVLRAQLRQVYDAYRTARLN